MNRLWPNWEVSNVAEKISMRIAYGQALAAYGAQNKNVVVLDADVSASTQTHYFARSFPDRFYNVGIAEAGMVDVAAGFALRGKIPFVNTFAFLLERATEQIRTAVAYSETNVKLVGSYGGLSDSVDGPTHQSVCDVAIMRSMPNMTVIVAADAVEIAKLVPLVAQLAGPVYLRVSRAEVPAVYAEDQTVEIGKGITLRDGKDVTLVATGVMVERALRAADMLATQGITARVLDLHTVKPLDAELLLTAASETGALVTAEEHSILGGLGGAVAELVSGECPVPIVRTGIKDAFCETGPYEALLDRYGMAVADIVAAAHKAIRLKK
jgi:transketolase